jgi:hypothetical protein
MGWPNNSTVCAAEGRRNGSSEDSPLTRLSGWPPSSASSRRSSRHCARTAAGTGQVRLPDLPFLLGRFRRLLGKSVWGKFREADQDVQA